MGVFKKKESNKLEKLKKDFLGDEEYNQQKIMEQVAEYNIKIKALKQNKDYDEVIKLCRKCIKLDMELNSNYFIPYPFVQLAIMLKKQHGFKECLELSDEYLKHDANNEYFIKLKNYALKELKKSKNRL